LTSVIPRDAALFAALDDVAAAKRIVVFAGLPGVGKSLLLQQTALIAQERGRRVHTFQWDVVRSAFETPELLAQYPEVDGFTHPRVMALVGEWLRGAVVRWHEAHAGPEHILIGEVALVGGRLMELAQPSNDKCEALLAGEETVFVLPVPTVQVRATIERERMRTSAQPQHEREAGDARPNVMQGLWEEAYGDAARAGLAHMPRDGTSIPYDPRVYRAIYEHWLRFRRTLVLPIDTVFDVQGSVYDVPAVESELRFNRA
jgi:hypothetical protein